MENLSHKIVLHLRRIGITEAAGEIRTLRGIKANADGPPAAELMAPKFVTKAHTFLPFPESVPLLPPRTHYGQLVFATR